MIHCNIKTPNPLNHELEITLQFEGNQKSIDLFLPLWRPGRYEAADYATNLSQFEALDADGKPLEWNRFQSNGWRVELGDNKIWSVKYHYYANKMDAGNSVVNEEQTYINFVNCILHADEQMDEQIGVTIDMSDTHKVACALPQTKHGHFMADGYHHLADSPLVASNHLKLLEYQVDATTFQIAFMGDHPLDDDKIIADFEKFTSSQCSVMGGFPSEKYIFLIQSLDYKHYHGVEHQCSTVLVLGPNTPDQKAEYYEKLMGVASHELFHSWNVTRIRPAEMSPYNYKKEISFDTGFVAEGFTTYYGDLFLMNAGVFSVDDYFKELDILCQRHFDNFGRFRISLIDSSKRLWLDGYKNLSPSGKVSIYVKGALSSLILDLNIREATNHRLALIDLIKKMYSLHTYEKDGYTWKNVLQLFHQIGGEKNAYLAEKLVESISPIEPLLEEALDLVGCQLVLSPHEDSFLAKTGVKIENNLITDIHPKSHVHRLSVGDEIITINDAAFDSKLTYEKTISILLKRNGKLHTINVDISPDEMVKKYQVRANPKANSRQLDFRKKWLNI